MLTAATATAQMSVGLRAGYGVFGAHFEPPALTGIQEPLYEPNFGIVAIFNDKSNAGIQVEVNYAVKGWRDWDREADTIEYKRELTYIEIPLMTHFEIGRGWFRIYGVVGPYIAFKQNETVTSRNFDAYIASSPYDLYNQKVRKIDLGNKAGLGFRINIGQRFSIFADARYDLQVAGGQNIFKKQPNGIQASRLSEIGGSVGLVFNILPQRTEVVKEYYVPKEGMNDGLDY